MSRRRCYCCEQAGERIFFRKRPKRYFHFSHAACVKLKEKSDSYDEKCGKRIECSVLWTFLSISYSPSKNDVKLLIYNGENCERKRVRKLLHEIIA